MNQNNNVPAYQSMPSVMELNSVKGFDHTRFIRIAKDGSYVLDLKYKKMWFRAAYPEGSIRPALLQKTDRLAIVEAKVYRNTTDTEPLASFIATRYANGPEGQHYIAAAQYEAEDQALSDAGFGIQLCDVSHGTAIDRLVASGAVPIGASVKPQAAQAAPVMQQPIAAAPPVAEPPPVAEQPVAAAPPVAEPPPVAEQPVAAAPPVAEMPPVAEQPVAAASPVAEPPPVAEQPVAAAPPVAEPPPVAEQPVAVAPPVAEPPPAVEQPETAPVPGEPIVFPGAQAAADGQQVSTAVVQQASRFTRDMPMETIYQAMTREEALAILVDVGTCKGWTLAEVSETRPASLKWYLNGYPGDNNVLKAGAYLLLNGEYAPDVAV